MLMHIREFSMKNIKMCFSPIHIYQFYSFLSIKCNGKKITCKLQQTEASRISRIQIFLVHVFHYPGKSGSQLKHAKLVNQSSFILSMNNCITQMYSLHANQCLRYVATLIMTKTCSSCTANLQNVLHGSIMHAYILRFPLIYLSVVVVFYVPFSFRLYNKQTHSSTTDTCGVYRVVFFLLPLCNPQYTWCTLICKCHQIVCLSLYICMCVEMEGKRNVEKSQNYNAKCRQRQRQRLWNVSKKETERRNKHRK